MSQTSKILGLGFTILKWSCVAHLIHEYGAGFVLCTGPSMEPTLTDNSIVCAEHLTAKYPKFRNIHHGDIVIVRSPTKPTQLVCKRVVGLSGDKIKRSFSLDYVPRGHLWLEGDNKYNSTDSRQYGPVPQALVVGRVIFKVWPNFEVLKV